MEKMNRIKTPVMMYTAFKKCTCFLIMLIFQIQLLNGQSAGETGITCEDLYLKELKEEVRVSNQENSFEIKDSLISRVLPCIVEKGNPDRVMEWYYLYVANISNHLKDDKQQIINCDSIINIFSPLSGKDTIKMHLYNALGGAYTRQGRYIEGIKNYEIALKIAEEIPLNSDGVNILFNLSNTSLFGYAYESAKRYLQLAKKKTKELDLPEKIKNRIAGELLMAGLMVKSGEKDSVLYYVKSAETILEKNKEELDPLIVNWAYGQILQKYLTNDNIDAARDTYQSFLKINPTGTYFELLQAWYFIKIKEYDSAGILIKKNEQHLKGVFSWLKAKYYEEIGDNTEALASGEEYLEYIKGNLVSKNIEYANMVSSRIYTDQKEKEILVMKERQEKLNMIWFLTLFGLLVGVIVLLAMVFSSREIRLKNKELNRLYDLGQRQLEVLKATQTKMGDFIRTLAFNSISYADIIIYNAEKPNYQSEGKSSGPIEKVHLYAKRLKEMSRNLIQYHFIEEDLVFSELDPNVVIDSVLLGFSDDLKSARVDIKPFAEKIIANRDLLQQVLANLIQNSLKFKKESIPLHLTFYGTPSETEPENFVICFKDNGIGIHESDKPYLFQKFFANGTGNQGAGLGLYLCKELVEKMNGNIWFDSEENQGTRFFISLKKV
jgi:signal transduction histidine kinase